MKLYQVLSFIFIVGISSCTDETSLIDIGNNAGIKFGVAGITPRSRAIEETRTPDILTLRCGGDTCNISQVDAIITVTDMDSCRKTSRSIPITNADAIGDFSIYSFYYSSETADPIPFFRNEKALRQSDYWSTPTLYYWPTSPGSTLNFWAMAGADSPGVEITESASDIGSMIINYDVPASSYNQKDLMLATTDRLNTPDKRVPLHFKHLCAAVRFVFGTEMQAGKIKSITLSGIMSHGQYTTQWSNLTGKTSFTINADKATTDTETAGTAILPDYNTLMMIPQQLEEDAMLTVVFQDDVTGTERHLTASLNGQTWKQGTVTTYHIGITSAFELEFTEPSETQDAHYVICNNNIRISGVPAGKSWTLSIEASDNADPSVQLSADVNEFVKQGFWTDKEIRNGTTITNVSARGTSIVKGYGSGDFPITIFLPENITEQDRTITLKLSVDNAPPRYTVTHEIRQLHPLWNGNEGWEQLDDNINGAYGFYYTAKIVYIYNNSSGLITAYRVRNMISNLVSQYNASSYVDYDSYNISLVSQRFYVAIDYSKLSNLGATASSPDDGHTNTVQLFNFGGSAISNTFEHALQQMKRIGTSNTPAFRRRANDDPSDVPQEVGGSLIDESQALTMVLKKNRYYLNRYSDSETGTETTAPKILENDILWYLPAYEQFGRMPAGNFTTGDFWSSTAYNDATRAYLGNGTTVPRMTQKKIRVVRNR
ncbi:fimbrillin family protein [Xylanibacter muris]|uniref:Fimbrillin family protein n=1 Tax=Xylanibacter muris TaxID=2736290 RepID=A0ABX2ALE6_9BACT|nr:fimbrillin family protein [Xylanibacter muris]NPD91077.1 fimbrillin family protein [Xylanibacter muris]